MAITTKKLEDLVDIFITDQFQEMEDEFYIVFENLDIDNSELQQLLNIAEVVGQDTLNITDLDILRGFIKAKIYQNASTGNYEDVYNVSKEITFADTVILEEIYPNALEVYTDGTIPSGFETYVVALLEKATAATVTIDSIKPIYSDGYLRVASGGTSSYSGAGLGLGKLGRIIA